MDQNGQEENDGGFKLIPDCYSSDNEMELAEIPSDKQKVQHVQDSLVVRFRVGPTETEIEGNKIILEGYSPMFKAMYSETWSAIESGHKNQVIILTQVDPDAFRMFLSLLNVQPLDQEYLKSLNCTVDVALHLLNLSKMYMVSHIEEECRKFLVASLRQDLCSIALIYESLKNTDEEELKERAFSELLQNFGLVMLNDTALVELSAETWIKIVLDTVQDNNERIYSLYILDEKAILRALIRWGVLKSDGNMMDQIKKILPCLLLNKIPDLKLDVILFFLTDEELQQVKKQQLEVVNARAERVRQQKLEKLHRKQEIENFDLLKSMCDDYIENREWRIKSGFNDAVAQDESVETNSTKTTVIVGANGTKIRGAKSIIQNFVPYLKSEMNWISVSPEPKNDGESVDDEPKLIIDLPDIEQDLLEKLQKVLSVADLTWTYFPTHNFTKIDVLDILCLSRIYFAQNVTAVCIEFFKNNSDPVNDSVFFVHVYEFLKNIQKPKDIEWAYELVKWNFARFLSNDSILGELSTKTWIKVLSNTRRNSLNRTAHLSGAAELDIYRGLLRWGEIQLRKRGYVDQSYGNVRIVVRTMLPFVLFGRIPPADASSFSDPIGVLTEYRRGMRFRL